MPFVLVATVDAADIDDLGHASNIVYLRWIQQAAVAHSEAVGLGTRAFVAQGQAFVVRQHLIDYLRPALVGDVLEIETRVTALGGASSERRTAIRRRGDGVIVARAVTKWAYIDLVRGRPVRVPEDVRARFEVDPPEPV